MRSPSITTQITGILLALFDFVVWMVVLLFVVGFFWAFVVEPIFK